MNNNEISKLKKEVESLKKKKQSAMVKSQTMQERNQLMKEIQQLEMAQKNPSLLKNFGKDFLKGLKTTGKTFWKGVTSASKNLDKNAPEFREFGKGMTRTSKSSKGMDLYLPKASGDYDQTRIPKKVSSPKKSKKNKRRKERNMMYPKSNQNMPFDLP